MSSPHGEPLTDDVDVVVVFSVVVGLVNTVGAVDPNSTDVE